jgi:hypothetical protein
MTDEEKAALGWLVGTIKPKGDAWEWPVWSD